MIYEEELLLLIDANGELKYDINSKLTFKNKLGFKNISLFSNFPETIITFDNSDVSQQPKVAEEKSKQLEPPFEIKSINKLGLDSKYTFNIYNESELIYKIKNNIDLKYKFSILYNKLKSNKLYDSLRNLKR